MTDRHDEEEPSAYRSSVRAATPGDELRRPGQVRFRGPP